MALVGYAHSDSLSVCMCRDSGNAERGGEAPWFAVGSPVRSPGPGTGVQKTSAVARARSLGTRGAGVRGRGRWTSRLEPRAWLPVPSPLCLFVVLGLRGRGHRVGAKAPLHSVDSFGCEFLPERPPRTHPEVGPQLTGPPQPRSRTRGGNAHSVFPQQMLIRPSVQRHDQPEAKTPFHRRGGWSVGVSRRRPEAPGLLVPMGAACCDRRSGPSPSVTLPRDDRMMAMPPSCQLRKLRVTVNPVPSVRKHPFPV